MSGSTPNGDSYTRVILILQNSLEDWMIGKPMLNCIEMMFWSIMIFGNDCEKYI